MRIFAIGDLHLPGGQEKPMDVFGSHWSRHPQRIAQAWQERVSPEDVVLVPGDISWAMTLDEALDDLAYLGRLPGTVLLVRGNHDYWWQSIGKVRAACPPNVHALQNDHVKLPGGWAVCGTRGWLLPGSDDFTAQDEKIYRRELQRLELSLASARRAGLQPLVVMLHFPPLPVGAASARTGFSDLLEAHQVRFCVYGHLHEPWQQRRAVQGLVRGVEYRLVACDALGFTPLRLLDLDEQAP